MPREKKTTSKRQTAPKTVKSARVTTEKLLVEESPQAKTQAPLRSFKMKRSYLLVFILVVSAVVLIYLLRGLFVVALVNGEPITRLSVVRELEKQGGAQISESLVTQTLIRQKAREKNVSVTKDEINKELTSLEDVYKQQGQKLDEVLSARGMTRDDLIEQIELKILLDKLVGEVKVTDEEVKAFIEQNNEAYGGTLKEEDVKKQLEDQKFSEKSSEYITNLQKEANVDYFVEY